MRLVGFCLMNNHFHLLLWPHKDGDLSRWMQWLMTAHVRRYHSSGHVWQGRFKAFPIQADDHYFTVLRYVERNPLRANMVKRSQDGEWSSLLPNARSGPDGLLCEGPLPKHSQWTRFVNGAGENKGTFYFKEKYNVPFLRLQINQVSKACENQLRRTFRQLGYPMLLR